MTLSTMVDIKESRGESEREETSITSADSVRADLEDLIPDGATEKELEGVEALRALLKEAGLAPGDEHEASLFTKVTLLRFLRARPTLDKSFAMFKEMLEWWRTYKPIEQSVRFKAELDTPEVQIVNEYWPCGPHGHDRRGCPIYYGRYGIMDLESIVATAGHETLLRRVMADQFEMAKGNAAAARMSGRAYATNVCVIDMEGLSWGRAYRALPAFGQLMKVLDNNFPERLQTCLVVRAPRVFSMLYKLASPLMSADTRAKIQILGRGVNPLPHLMEHADIDQIPSFLGGKSDTWAHGCGGDAKKSTARK